MSSSGKAKEKEPKEKTRKVNFVWPLIAFFVVAAIAVFVITHFNFNDAFESAKDQAYQNAYDKSFDYYERKNHVSNHATLTIGTIREENKLEVLNVSDSWLKIDNDDEDDHVTRWIKFTGSAVYTVDMSAAEFLIDSDRGYILAKLPTPVLSDVALDEDPNSPGTPAAEVLHYEYKSGFGHVNGTYEKGTAEFDSDKKEAQEKLSAALRNNAGNDEKAKESAEMFVREFLKNVNADWHLSDEDIQIEFT